MIDRRLRHRRAGVGAEDQRRVVVPAHQQIDRGELSRVEARVSARQIDADFADVFEVKARSMPPRLAVLRHPHERGFVLSYERRGFQRGLDVSLVAADKPMAVGSQLVLDLVLAPGVPWSVRSIDGPDAPAPVG